MNPKKQYLITEDLKQKILAAVDITALISSDIKLTKLSSKNMTACCPFHSENTPSFTVSTTKGFYHCFGCGAHGDSISWVMAYKGLDYVEALVHLAEFANMEIPTITLDEKNNFNELVALNKWVIGSLKKQTETDHSPLAPILGRIINVKPHHTDNDESYVSDLIAVKSLQVRNFRDFQKVRDVPEVLSLVKVFDSLKKQTAGHFVRDRRGFVSGICIENKNSKSQFTFVPLPLGKKLNESILGMEQISQEETEVKKSLLVFNNPHDYFCHRLLLTHEYCLSHPVNSTYFSNDQLQDIAAFTRKMLANRLFAGGVFFQGPTDNSQTELFLPALRFLHSDLELMSKSGVLISREFLNRAQSDYQTLEVDGNNVVDVLRYVIQLAKTKLNLSAKITPRESYHLLNEVVSMLELNIEHVHTKQILSHYCNLLAIPTDVYITSKKIESNPLVKRLLGNSLQELCFAIMCNRPHLAVQFHTQIESYMETNSTHAEANSPDKTEKIFSDFDIGAKVGQIFLASSVCSDVIENHALGDNKIVSIAKRMEIDIDKKFAVNFIELGLKHRSVVEQMPENVSPLFLIQNINSLIKNFESRMMNLTEYDRYVILASMNENLLPMSSFAALTMDLVIEQDGSLSAHDVSP